MSANQPAFRVFTAEGENGPVVSFPPGTELSEANAEAFQRELTALIPGGNTLTVDLSGINVLTSVILSKFLAINKQVRAAGGKLAIRNATATVHAVFKVTRLDTVLDIRTGA